ncbi:MAG: hypothetical protein H7Z37_09525 [Pyrinomonadaceae bacterium]|nr:hypothetical protein [Pyrinomonadaceae bacterium]
MAQIHLVEYNPEIHFDYMSSFNESGIAIENPHLIKGKRFVFVLTIGGKSLIFKDVAQMKEAKDFFERKLRPSTIGNPPPYENFWQIWFGRLPKKVLKASNKEKILKAINSALEKYENTY